MPLFRGFFDLYSRVLLKKAVQLLSRENAPSDLDRPSLLWTQFPFTGSSQVHTRSDENASLD
jgi:hypothetical protein